MNRRSFLSSLLAIMLLLGACSPGVTLVPSPLPGGSVTSPTQTAPTIRLTDGLGRSITLRAPAARIVSLAASNTEILFSIGAGGQLVGRDHNSDFPPQAKKIADVGGSDISDRLNTELIASMKPDLVLVTAITPVEQVKTLEKLGIPVFMLDNPVDLAGMYANLRTVAQLTGHATEAQALITRLQARVEAVGARVAGATRKPLVYYEIDGSDPDAPWTSGPGTYIDTLIGLAGGRNVGTGLKDPWAQISLEELVRQDPDVIVLGDSVWGGNTPALVRQRPGWGALAAVKNQAIHPFDDNLMSRPGPRLVDGLEALARLLHPELFK